MPAPTIATQQAHIECFEHNEEDVAAWVDRIESAIRMSIGIGVIVVAGESRHD